MDMNNKQVYQAPESVQYEVRLEGVIAASGEGYRQGYGDWITNEWGN